MFSPAPPLRPRVPVIALGRTARLPPMPAVVFAADDSAVPWAVASWARRRARARSSQPRARARSICRAACSSTGSPRGHRLQAGAQRLPAPRPLRRLPWPHKPECGGPGGGSCRGRSELFSGSRAEDRSPAVGALSQQGAHCSPHPALPWKENGRKCHAAREAAGPACPGREEGCLGHGASHRPVAPKSR